MYHMMIKVKKFIYLCVYSDPPFRVLLCCFIIVTNGTLIPIKNKRKISLCLLNKRLKEEY